MDSGRVPARIGSLSIGRAQAEQRPPQVAIGGVAGKSEKSEKGFRKTVDGVQKSTGTGREDWNALEDRSSGRGITTSTNTNTAATGATGATGAKSSANIKIGISINTRRSTRETAPMLASL